MKATVRCSVCTVTCHRLVCLQRLTYSFCLSCYWPLFSLLSSSLQHPQTHRIPAHALWDSVLYWFSPKLRVKYTPSIIRLLVLLFIYLKKCLSYSPGCLWICGKVPELPSQMLALEWWDTTSNSNPFLLGIKCWMYLRWQQIWSFVKIYIKKAFSLLHQVQ